MTDDAVFDPKGLIKDAFAIEGIAAPECRSIFLDWALGVPAGVDMRTEAQKLLAHYEGRAPTDHPMMDTLRAAQQAPTAAKRRGGRRGRI